jgi:hypothetical protein
MLSQAIVSLSDVCWNKVAHCISGSRFYFDLFVLELNPHTYIYFYWSSTHTLILIYIVVIGLDQLLQLDHCSIGNLFHSFMRTTFLFV